MNNSKEMFNHTTNYYLSDDDVHFLQPSAREHTIVSLT